MILLQLTVFNKRSVVLQSGNKVQPKLSFERQTCQAQMSQSSDIGGGITRAAQNEENEGRQSRNVSTQTPKNLNTEVFF